MGTLAEEPVRVSDLARQMDVSVETLNDWLRAGKVPEAFKSGGGHWRIPRDVAEQLIRDRREGRR